MGFEGSGIIEEAPHQHNQLKGKKISFCCNYEDKNYCGSWSDYTVIKKENMIIFPEKLQSRIDMKQAACLYINPLTAFCFTKIIKKFNMNSAINTAGLSAVGKVFTKLAKKNNFKIINMIRNEENKEKMEKIGSYYTICLGNKDANYIKSELKKVSQENKVKLAFECIGGQTTGIVLECLEEEGKMYHYGNLSLRSITNLNTNDFIFKKKSIEGFWLFDFIRKNYKNIDDFYDEFLNEYILNFEDKIFDVDIQNIIKPENFEEASKLYRNDMSKGKVLLDFTI